MSDPTVPPASGVPAVKDETGLLDVLQILIQSGKARTTADLLKYAGQYGAPESEERLRMLDAEGVPLELAFDAISVHLRILSHKRNSSLLAECRGKKVGLVLPMAPHVVELFVPIAECAFLQPDETPLHGALHQYEDRVVKGPRPCRTKVQEMEALVFEAFRDGDGFQVDAAAGEILEPKMLPEGVRLIAHLRPHPNPQDVRFAPPTTVSFI
jgi:hypothetical protein